MIKAAPITIPSPKGFSKSRIVIPKKEKEIQMGNTKQSPRIEEEKNTGKHCSNYTEGRIKSLPSIDTFLRHCTTTGSSPCFDDCFNINHQPRVFVKSATLHERLY